MIVQGPSVSFNPSSSFFDPTEELTQTILWNRVLSENDFIGGEPNPRCGIKYFFSSWSKQDGDNWPHFEEGWVMQASMTVSVDDGNKEIYILSNEVPITQEIFKYFVGWTEEELKNRCKITDMEIKNYSLVNKIVNQVVQLDRPDKSKTNIIQPVFFRTHDTEMLTLHPAVTENICINLDNYKSKVEMFYLQIDNCRFSQIGANQYGIIFKIDGSSLPIDVTEGTYYILNENYDLVTKGKYKYSL